MKKHKTALFAAIIISMAFFYNGLGCARPLGLTINNNKKMAKLIPVLREDAPLIIEKLEILRLGYAKENEYSIYLSADQYLGRGGYLYRDGDYIYRGDNNYEGDPLILMSDSYSGGGSFYNFTERQEKFSAEEIDAVNYLLLSDELQLNVLSFHFVVDNWASPYAVFAGDDWYALGIYYFDPDKDTMLEVYRRLGDYVEELEGNYWLVMWFVPRG